MDSTFNTFTGRNMFRHINLLKQLGFEPGFIIDIGAYIGNWTRETHKIYPKSKILMVEAQGSKSDVLTTLANSIENVYYENALLGDAVRENVKFYEMETGSSIYQENTKTKREIQYLSMKTLDSLLTRHELSGEGFIKLDVQGAELDILKGAKNTLEKTEFILLEASTLNYNQNAPLFADIISFLDEEGYCVFDICGEKRKLDNVLFQVDLIFIRKKSSYFNQINFSNPTNNQQVQR